MNVTQTIKCTAKDIPFGQGCLHSSNLYVRLDEHFYSVMSPNEREVAEGFISIPFMDAKNGQITLLMAESPVVPVVVECTVRGYGMAMEHFAEIQAKHYSDMATQGLAEPL